MFLPQPVVSVLCGRIVGRKDPDHRHVRISSATKAVVSIAGARRVECMALIGADDHCPTTL
jgi:hypothetical protein